MALPTMQPFWMKNYRTATEGLHVRRSQHEADFRNSWDRTARYFNRAEAEVSKQNDWTSDRSRCKSNDKLERTYAQSKKSEILAARRTKLAKLLMDEAKQYEKELRDLKFPSSDRLSQMRNRVDELKSEREDRRKLEANRKLYEYWRQNEPSLRKIESDQHMKSVVDSWSGQLSERDEALKTAREEDKKLRHMMELKQMKEEEEEAKKREARREQDLMNADGLRIQMQELRMKEEEAEMLKKEQEMLLSQQRLIEESEEKRKQFEEQRKKHEFGRVLIRQYKAQLRRKSKAVQDALELDLRILEDLSKKEDDEKTRYTARREQAKADAEFMKKVVAEQLQLEKKRESELDMLYQEEAARQWQKREIEWERERVAREKLMNEVLAERQTQITTKLGLVHEKQQESILRREELVRAMEKQREEQEREKEEEQRKKRAQNEELQAQITSRQEKFHEARARDEMETRRNRLEQQEYESFLQREAQVMSARGVTPRHFPRRRVAFD